MSDPKRAPTELMMPTAFKVAEFGGGGGLDSSPVGTGAGVTSAVAGAGGGTSAGGGGDGGDVDGAGGVASSVPSTAIRAFRRRLLLRLLGSPIRQTTTCSRGVSDLKPIPIRPSLRPCTESHSPSPSREREDTKPTRNES
ncbi:uncharacterized protein A4U43_C06F2260 [Asparagus officinalis]|uniref:Uncharacterized protein n=1 Tax=Asparagus officinalis TaxID=4686 RepID=A0A5P1EMX7_ASPOF|nr:uncharacterized protein A4U43_C06F2260 [Asparagus officinalis]